MAFNPGSMGMGRQRQSPLQAGADGMGAAMGNMAAPPAPSQLAAMGQTGPDPAAMMQLAKAKSRFARKGGKKKAHRKGKTVAKRRKKR